MTTQALPFGLEVEAGLMLTEFGIINTQHSHSWDWQDQPIVVSRMFGPDGQRLVGARLGWIVLVPWFAQLHVGVQNATSNLAPSFNGAFHMHGGEEGGHSHGGEEEEETVVGQRPLAPQEVDGPEDMLYLVRLKTPGNCHTRSRPSLACHPCSGRMPPVRTGAASWRAPISK